MIIFSASRWPDTTGTTLNDEVQASDLDLTQQYRATIEFCEGALGIDESSYLAYQVLGRVHQAQGRLQEAIHAGERVVQISGDVPVERGLLATYYGLAGRHKEARQILEELQELGKTRYVPATSVAGILLGLGESNRAWQWLEKAVRERDCAYRKCYPARMPLKSAMFKKVETEGAHQGTIMSQCYWAGKILLGWQNCNSPATGIRDRIACLRPLRAWSPSSSIPRR